MRLWQSLTGIAALIFCGTSLAFTVQLWIAIPSTTGSQVVAGLAAVALELCKFSFAPLGLWLRSHGQLSGHVLLALWPLLVVISIVATVGFLATHNEEQQQRSTQGSLEYQALKQQLNSIKEQINSLNDLIATDAANGYRQRAIDTTVQLRALEAQRSQLIESLSIAKPGASTHGAFNSLASTLNIDPVRLQHAGFLALAIITDVVGLVALLAFNAASTVCKRLAKRSKRFSTPDKQFSTDSKRFSTDAKQSPTEPKQLLNDAKQLPTVDKRFSTETQESLTVSKQSAKRPKRFSTPVKQLSTEPKRFVNAGLSQEQIELANRICAGEFGTRPVLRNIIKCIRGGYPAAKPVFDALEQAGEITRDGQRFCLTGRR
ncbi:hypothetical protein [Microbulbifer spongiae]|uniref:Uncharacterized protein n=1 Tax=Microbulbifer spongiae TaxID=2944933 RepID=A0ABY9EG70_9GAMM|nr:hypothetical protein [Microbulbifer sp. MI-G]WKD51093.1 hypothetical protein M8T91_06630 [Microbulbifer sp. MI-G]